MNQKPSNETGQAVWARRLAKALSERDEARTAIKFLMSQMERLAYRAFSDEVEEWLARNDAMNCGRRALGVPCPQDQQSATATN